MSVCLKIDEDLPGNWPGCLMYVAMTHLTVVEQGWQGVAEVHPLVADQSERRWLITAGKGFADLRQHPPGNHAGVILRAPRRESARTWSLPALPSGK